MLIIPFAFILLLQSLHVGLEDIVKIPELIEHYQEHKIEHGDDFLSFLNKHYGSEKHDHNSEDPDHENLPFHHTQHLCIDLKVEVPIAFYLNDIHLDQSKHFFVYNEPITSKATCAIHQPPKNNC
mgnify:CR=1 FL=1